MLRDNKFNEEPAIQKKKQLASLDRLVEKSNAILSETKEYKIGSLRK